MERFSRTESLIGLPDAQKLYAARVAVFGLGGVGGYAVEALARVGVGTLILVDGDKINESNINRQLIALTSTLGQYKAEAFKNRIAEINPYAEVIAKNVFYTAENAEIVDFSELDYIIDAIDSVSGKLEIIRRAKEADIPVISAMGAGNKLNASFKVADISKTAACPLARIMRRELKKQGISGVKTVYSEEIPRVKTTASGEAERGVPASISYVPSVMGLIIAGEVIKDLIGANDGKGDKK